MFNYVISGGLKKKKNKSGKENIYKEDYSYI